MAKKVIKRTMGASSCNLSIKPHKENLREAICEICDRVFTTDEEVYVCPECKRKAKNIHQ